MLLPLLLVLAIPQGKPPAKPAAAAAELKFAWPERIEASVETERHKEERRGTTAPKVTTVKMRYRMGVEPHPKGRLIRFSDYTLLGPSTAQPAGEDVSQVLTLLQPSVIVSAEGAFQSVQDIAGVRAAMLELVGGVKGTQDGPAALKELMANLTSEQFLQAMAANEWQVLAETWIGLPLTNEWLPFETEQPIAIFPGMTVTIKGTVGLISKAPCNRGGSAVTCGTFEMKTSTDPKVIEAVMKRMFSGEKGFEGVKFERYDLRTTVRLVAETDTMLPHELSITKTLDMAITGSKEGRMEGTQVEKRTSRYLYGPPK